MNEDEIETDVSEVFSLESVARDPQLLLPSSTDPPGPHNHPKQLVWVVSFLSMLEKRELDY
jgi:hypothetical protein